MLKEIDEQPAVIRKIIQSYQNEQGKLTIDPEIVDALHEADRIYIIAAGTILPCWSCRKTILLKKWQVFQ